MKRLRSLICGAALLGPLGTSSALAPALLCAAALTAAAAIAPSPAQAILGDVNCDGVVNATDAQVLANFLVGITTSVPCPQNADVNGDGQVNVADVLLILQLSKGLRTSFSYQSTSVLAVTPSSGAANILLGAEISAIFSNPVSSASLPGNFTVADAVSGQISTGTFRCSQNGTISVFTPGVPLLPAHNYVVSLSTGITDNFGNPISTSVGVNFQTQPLGTMNLTSVNNSTATMNTLLSNPISVQLFTSTGAPAVQVPVVFVAQMGNGTLQPSGLRQVTVLTDNNGNATIAYKTGTQAMVNTVAISAVGFSTVPVFQIQTAPTQPVNLRLYTGGNQTGGAGSVAPLPLVVQATDAGGDYIQGTTVTFTVPAGQGSFAGQVSSSVVTNSTGTSAVMFTFGPSSGTVIVSASFTGMVGQAPTFSLYGILPQLSTSAYIGGNVIDSQTLLPLTSVYVYLTDNPSVWERTDQNGNFVLPASTGPHVVEVDGFESGLIGGQMYPTVSFPVNGVQGQTTGLGAPATLPKLDQQSYLDVSDVQGGTLTIRSYPQWQLYIAPGQATFQNGSHTGRIYASFVSHDHIPMPVAGGKTSRFDDTIQPPTVIFNPPAQITFPSVDGLAPGTMTEIFTLDYVSGAFKRTGRGLVSADGRTITSLPGQGITQGGWHLAPDPNPPPQGCVSGTLGSSGGGCSSVYLNGPGGQSSPCSQLPSGQWHCQLCGLAAGSGPANVTASCGLLPGVPPPLGGPLVGGPGGGPTTPPFGPPSGPPTPSTPITANVNLQVALPPGQTSVTAGDQVAFTVTVTLSDPSVSNSGINVTLDDNPNGALPGPTFNFTQLGFAATIGSTINGTISFIGTVLAPAPSQSIQVPVTATVFLSNNPNLNLSKPGIDTKVVEEDPCQQPTSIAITPPNIFTPALSPQIVTVPANTIPVAATIKFSGQPSPQTRHCPINIQWSPSGQPASVPPGTIVTNGPPEEFDATTETQGVEFEAATVTGFGNIIAQETKYSISSKPGIAAYIVSPGVYTCTNLLGTNPISPCQFNCVNVIDATQRYFRAYNLIPNTPWYDPATKRCRTTFKETINISSN